MSLSIKNVKGYSETKIMRFATSNKYKISGREKKSKNLKQTVYITFLLWNMNLPS